MRTPRTLLTAGAAVLLSLGLLTSCAQEAEISDAAAERLQAEVLNIATLSSNDDFSGAIAALDALEASLAETTASGDVTAERSARIQELIVSVRSDLAEAVPSTPTEEPAPVETTEPEPSETPTPTPEPTESDEPTDTPSETPTAPDENEDEPDENEPDENEPDENENNPGPADPASPTGNNGNGNGNGPGSNNGVGPDGTGPGNKNG